MCSSRSRSRYSVSAAYLLKPGKAATQVVDVHYSQAGRQYSLWECVGWGSDSSTASPEYERFGLLRQIDVSRATTATCCLLVLLSFLHILPVCRLGSSSKKKQAPSQAAIRYPFLAVSCSR
jgi:hypothetical protein